MLTAGAMSNKSNKNKRNKPTEQSKPQNENKESIGPSTATIIAAIIGLIGVVIVAAFTYRGVQTSVYGPIHATETAHTDYLTQIALTPNSTPTLAPTRVFTITPTETITPYPEPSINVIAPTRDNLNLVPIIYFGYQKIKTPGTRIYKINVSSKVTYLWKSLWCTKHSGTLAENLNQIKFSFFIDDIQIPESKFLIFKEPRGTDGWPCQRWTTMLSGWNTTHFPTLSVVYYIPMPLSDGVDTYSIGEYRYDIIVAIID